VIVDDLSNSFPRVFRHMQKLAGDKAGMMKFVKVRVGGGGLPLKSTADTSTATATNQCTTLQADVGDKAALDAVFESEKWVRSAPLRPC
jgi:hypothetical protein